MDIADIILASLWIIYCLLHSLLASPAFKKWMTKVMGKHFKYYRLYYTLFALISLAGIILYQLSISQKLIFRGNYFIMVAGTLASLTGLVIMAVCIRKYFMQLSGLRSLIESRPNNKLMITGIHRHVRHPLYTGTFLFIWGLLIVFPYTSLLIADSVITIYTLAGIQLEENKLISEFGKPYEEYRRNTPMIIPHLPLKLNS